MNVLIVAAHPDDELLGVGGTIAWHIQQGDSVHVILMGEGATSRSETREQASANGPAKLRQCAEQAAKLLGYAENLHQLGLPDNRFDQLELLDVVKKIESISAGIKPDIVYTHYWGDLNIDHVITARAVQTAFRPLPTQTVKRILCFETVSATGWSSPDQYFSPTVYVDIGATLATKLDALGVYQTEMCEFPHARSLEAVKAKAISRGSEVGVSAAEAFVLVREVISNQ